MKVYILVQGKNLCMVSQVETDCPLIARVGSVVRADVKTQVPIALRLVAREGTRYERLAGSALKY